MLVTIRRSYFSTSRAVSARSAGDEPGVGRRRQVGADVERDDVGALGREADGLGPALTAGGAGDEDHLALETAGCCPLA